ncbi:alkaline phosphatase [Psychrobacillus sp. FSL H8-0510]|uniref:alkaline phosphatase n=1 Tax=Psychrobacillus sp. FSL H8-0510 TaxID=2921394 RepID=UPI0030F666F2
MYLNKKLFLIFLVTILLIAVSSVDKNTAYGNKDMPLSKGHPKNVILMIADGYSTAYATNYRLYKDQESLLDPYLSGMVKTYSASSEITDSAAAATALATGYKTYNGRISTSIDGKPLKTIMEAIEDEGRKSTGLVATTSVTDATPAAFASHTGVRADQYEIAPQLIANDVDVLLSGGKKFFPDSLIESAIEKDYVFISDRDQLLNSNSNEKLLGLFSEENMAPELDREETNQPSLAEMTLTAINVLNKNKNGFFLMVEGSQIDLAGHYHDAAWAMQDIESFEKAFSEVMDFAKKDKNTLVVVLGDHDTGGMSVGGYNKFGSNIEILRNVTASGDFMVNKFSSTKNNIKEVIKEYTNITLTDQQVDRISTSTNPSAEVNNIVSEYALVGWITGGHTGVDVPLYTYGPKSENFKAVLDNTDIPKLISKAIKLEF